MLLPLLHPPSDKILFFSEMLPYQQLLWEASCNLFPLDKGSYSVLLKPAQLSTAHSYLVSQACLLAEGTLSPEAVSLAVSLLGYILHNFGT